MNQGNELLDRIVTYYLESGDFNGLYIGSGDAAAAVVDDLTTLVTAGLVQVVTEADYPNAHIKPWPSRRSIDDQVADIRALAASHGGGACLYPTPAAMEGRLSESEFRNEPYRRLLALGRGKLELVYFDLDVLEQYRNDPRYHYTFSDFEVSFGISGSAYTDDLEPERDKIVSVRCGFAYDTESLSSDRVRRYVCSFICDLADLTPEHQRRWETYERPSAENVSRHPVWWGMMMGHWPDGIGPFDKLIVEMEAINELFVLAYGTPLFRTVERPREWGWIIRNSSSAWHEFVLTTDKLLSDNLRHDALTAAGVTRDAPDGSKLGTLVRLQRFLTDKARVAETQARAWAAPLREVRAERQRPAHALDAPMTDATVAARQRNLLADLADCLIALRTLLQRHPKAKEWEPAEELDGKWYRL